MLGHAAEQALPWAAVSKSLAEAHSNAIGPDNRWSPEEVDKLYGPLAKRYDGAAPAAAGGQNPPSTTGASDAAAGLGDWSEMFKNPYTAFGVPQGIYGLLSFLDGRGGGIESLLPLLLGSGLTAHDLGASCGQEGQTPPAAAPAAASCEPTMRDAAQAIAGDDEAYHRPLDLHPTGRVGRRTRSATP